MLGGALGVTEFHGAGFGIELALDEFGESIRGAGEHGMTEGVEAGFVRADFFAGFVLQTFTDHHDTIMIRGHGFFHLREELLFVERQFGQQNDVRRIGRVAFGDNGARSNPPRGAPHHFHDTARAVVGRHAGDIVTNFHHGGGIVFDDRTITGAAIRVRQIVIDGFRHADDAHVPAAFDGFEMNFVRGILRIISADVKKESDIVVDELMKG